MVDVTSDELGSDLGVQYEYREMVHVHAVRPSSGSLQGGNRVTITGEGFDVNGTGYCRFGGDEGASSSLADVLTSSAAVCVVPARLQPEVVAVEVSFSDGQAYSTDGVQFAFYSEPVVESVSPSFASTAGGSSVTFVGSNFADTSDLTCRFGVRSVARSMRLSASLVVCTAPSSSPGNVSLEVSNNGVDFTKTGLRFTFKETMTFQMSPSRGPVVGGTVVTVTGLDNSGDVMQSLVFGSMRVPIEVREGVARAIVPAGPGAGVVNVTSDEVNANLIASFHYFDVTSVLSVRPSLGFVTKTSLVTLVGSGFVFKTNYWLHLNRDRSVPASFVSSTIVLANVPCNTMGPMSIDVSLEKFAADGTGYLGFECANLMKITYLSPSQGQMDGGDLILVHGSHFINTDHMSCRFGLRGIVPAVYKSSTTVSCISPPRHIGNVTVELFFDGSDVTTSGVKFSFLATTVHQVFPSKGPVRGGTTITILASQFPAKMFECVFAADSVPAILVNDTMALCISPPSESGTVVLEIADVKMQNLRFRYEEDASLQYIYPQVGSSTGGDIIKAVGHGFTEDSVSFISGSRLSQADAKWISSSLILLKSPPAREPGDVSIEVTNFPSAGNQTFGQFAFRYEKPLTVSSVHPTKLPITGAHLVTIRGENFIPSWKYVCQFGGVAQQQATYASTSEIHCLAPTFSAGNASLRIGYSAGALLATGLTVSFQMEATVDHIFPVISSKSGGIEVTIQGRQFNTAEVATCFFGRVSVPALIVSDSIMTCVTPPSKDDSVDLEVMIDGSVISQPGLQVNYIEDPRVSKLYPSAGPSEGNTPVSVFGSNFRGSSLICLFSGIGRVNAVSQTHSVAVCVSPPASRGVYTVEVEIDGCKSSTVAEYEYEAPLRANALVPSVGPVQGGTMVTVMGEGFSNSKGVWCKFGDYLLARGEWIDASSVACLTPESDVGNRTLEVSVNGVDYTQDSLLLSFVPRLSISGIIPSLGPVEGGTSVTFTGWSLDQYEDLHCRFGTSVLPIVSGTTSTIICRTPSHAVGHASVTVMNFADSTTLEIPFIFVPNVMLLRLEPSSSQVSSGTIVTVIGENMRRSSMCKFGQRHAECSYLTSSSLKCYAPFHPVSEVFVELTNNGVDYTDSKKSFAYLQRARVISVEPSIASTAGATTVTVNGENFCLDCIVECRFGSYPATRGRLVSGNEMRCTTPESSPANVTFTISFNGEEYVDSSVNFMFEENFAIAKLHPTLGPVSGNTLVTITGTFHDVAYTCKFGFSLVPARYASVNTRTCRSPSSREGISTVEISANQVDWTKNRRKFYFHPLQMISSLLPSTGTLEGRTLVQVFGSSFQKAPSTCKFGSHIVDAIVVDSNLIHCNAPLSTAPGAVSFELSQNSQDYTNSGISYLYHEIVIDRLEPTGGPSTGNTQVNIIGSGFLNLLTLRCKFGNTVVAAIWISPEEIWCTSPAGYEGLAELEVSNNNADFSAQGNKFEYYTRTTVVRVAPSSGVNSGNTEVTVFGTNFVNSSSLVCRFGIAVVPVLKFISPSRLVCNTVPYESVQVSLEISNNKRDFTVNGVQFLYTELPVIRNILPSSGPTKGQTIVTLVGDHFGNSTDLRCKLGSVLAYGKWVSPSLITCRTPYGRPGISTLEVSNNAVDFSFSDSQFLFYEPMEIYSISPSVGPSTRAGTIVTVEGAAVRNVYGLSCRFGLTVVPAQFISEKLFQCRTPAASPGLLPFEASLNRMDFTKAGKAFLFQTEISIATLLPNYGLDVGNTPVFLTGMNFFNSSALSCRFGAKTVKAVFLSQNTIFCLSPPQSPGSVDLEASNNGIDYTSSRLLYHYRVCPTGSFCVGGEIVACPAGAYCPANGLHNFTLCPPGLYQDRNGQRVCKRCTTGAICPDFGMPFPQDCPPGYVCDKTGLAVPSKPCPPGHYCLAGTKTSNAKDTTIKKRPLPCPQGFYCSSGAVTSVSILLNFTTPQPCFPGYFCSPGSETPHGQGPCPSGFHCPQYSPGMVKACPPGTFCPSVGNVEPLPCKPGSFNENYAQSMCNTCPLGRMCPTFGLLTPRMCPAGYVCDEVGKATWSKLCPAGYWCGEGTLTANASSALSPKPNPCAPGTYCLMGVTTNRTVPGRLDTAQICVEGTYCQASTGSPQGTAPCPRGYYCGTGVSAPSPARPGFYVNRPGSVLEVPCSPGTFTATVGTIQCMACPAGHSCADDGTVSPGPCEAGQYRSVTDSVSCMLCPTGTWSTRKGLTDESLCEPCPPGVVCSIAGMVDLNVSSPCPEGYVCGPRTNSENQFDVKCPPGYICVFGTTPETQYNMLCEAGYGCPEGTSWNTRNLMPCMSGFYCPPGSVSSSPPITLCPIGTTSDEGAKSEYDCYRNQVESICRVSPYYSNSSFDADLSFCMLRWTCWKTTPQDVKAQELCVTKGLLEARYDFGEDLKNPIKKELPSQWQYIEAFGVAKIKLDFQNIPHELTYEDHFEIAIYYYNKSQPIRVHKRYGNNQQGTNSGGCQYFTLNEEEFFDETCSESDGTWFGDRSVDKHGMLQFTISGHTEIYFRVEIEIYHGRFIGNKNFTAFKNTMEIEKYYPSRANYNTRYENCDEYDPKNFNMTDCASLQTGERRAASSGSCVIQRNADGYKGTGQSRDCTKFFLIALDSSNSELNAALNVEAPYMSTPDGTEEDENDKGWKFQTMPWIDFVTTNKSIPMVPQPFKSIGNVKGVGLTNDFAYPQPWKFDGLNEDGQNPMVGSGDSSMIMLPYLPFFSSCRGFDSHIYLFRILESRTLAEDEYTQGQMGEGCKLRPSQKTRPIDPYLGFIPSLSPTEDELIGPNPPQDYCDWTFKCSYEEEIEKAAVPLRWFSQPEGAALFYITLDSFDQREYRNLKSFKSMAQTKRLTRATVRYPEAVDQLLLAVGVPGEVTLTIQYFQVTKTRKQIIKVYVDLDRFREVKNETDPTEREYKLHVTYHGLAWAQCLNFFAYNILVYFTVFVVVGFCYCVFAAIFWAFHRLMTRLSNPPSFRFMSYAALTVPQPTVGFLFCIIPFFSCVLFLHVFFFRSDISFEFLTKEKMGFGPLNQVYGLDDREEWDFVQQGRFAVALFVVGFYIMHQGARLLIPKKESTIVEEVTTTEESETKIWAPGLWHQSHLLLANFVTVFFCLIIFEFSFSSVFGNNVYSSLVVLLVFRLFYSAFLEEVLGEVMITLAHDIVIDLVVGMCTMGAADLISFMQGFFLDSFLAIAQRVYVDPGISSMLEKIDWLFEIYEKYRQQQEALRDEEADDDMDAGIWGDEDEEDLTSPVEDIIGSYVSYSCEAIGNLFSPFTILFVMWTEPVMQLGAKYGILVTDFEYYYVFAFTMIPFFMVKDLFLHNVTELYHGWKVYEYMKYCKHRYTKRQFRWKSNDPNEDESISEGIRSLDLLCFSSQYYFIVSVATMGLGLVVMSIECLLRQQDRVKSKPPYNPFADKMLPFVIALTFAFMKFLHFECLTIGYKVLWRHKLKVADIEDAGMLIDPDKGALDLPDWNGAGFGQGGPGGNNIDITSDSFRHRFFEANKPWIIQQLRSTMSPRAQLEALAKGEAFPEDFGARGDITSDDGTDSDSDRDGDFELDAMAKTVARRWLSKTRRRLGLPDRAQGGLDISSDDDSSDSDDDEGRPAPKLNHASEEIARRWLANARGQIRHVEDQEEVKATRGDISSDDESEKGEADRPVIAMSAQSRTIAKMWLGKVRTGGEQGPTRRVNDISDDDSSESEDYGTSGMTVGPKAKEIAKKWLQAIRRGGGDRTAPVDDISDDDSSSDSEGGLRASANPPPNLSTKTKAIAMAWIRQIRRR